MTTSTKRDPRSDWCLLYTKNKRYDQRFGTTEYGHDGDCRTDSKEWTFKFPSQSKMRLYTGGWIKIVLSPLQKRNYNWGIKFRVGEVQNSSFVSTKHNLSGVPWELRTYCELQHEVTVLINRKSYLNIVQMMRGTSIFFTKLYTNFTSISISILLVMRRGMSFFPMMLQLGVFWWQQSFTPTEHWK